MKGEWYYHLYETPCANDMDYYDGMSGKLANGFPVPRNPNARPITLGTVDQAIRDVYLPGLLADLNRPILFDAFGIQPVETVPTPRWKRFLYALHERFNDSYMHLRYGQCDEEREWNEHVC